MTTTNKNSRTSPTPRRTRSVQERKRALDALPSEDFYRVCNSYMALEAFAAATPELQDHMGVFPNLPAPWLFITTTAFGHDHLLESIRVFILDTVGEKAWWTQGIQHTLIGFESDVPGQNISFRYVILLEEGDTLDGLAEFFPSV